MLNNKATQAKLENTNYLAMQTKQCDKQGYSNRISHTRELLLCYTSKKITSELHKLTNHKSKYTSTMYMKVNTSLCKRECKPIGRTMLTQLFFSRGSRVCQHASPRCVDCSLGGSEANWHHLPSPHIGHRRNLP
jgi:hypothetical protein